MVSQLLGGIGLFLLGVFLMTDGLKTAAGDKLRRMLVRFTGRPATAFVSGAGITVLPETALAARYANPLVKVVDFTEPVPMRRVALAWRRSFARRGAVELLAQTLRRLDLPVRALKP